MSKNEEMRRLMRLYKEEMDVREVNMKDLAEWAMHKGWPAPEPISPRDRLAKQFAVAAREETKIDFETGDPYRVNHMYYVVPEGGGDQYPLWIDIDEAPREAMHASLTMRREQVVGDMTQLIFDAEHWSRANRNEDPITMQMDLGLDVAIRRHSRDEDEGED